MKEYEIKKDKNGCFRALDIENLMKTVDHAEAITYIWICSEVLFDSIQHFMTIGFDGHRMIAFNQDILMFTILKRPIFFINEPEYNEVLKFRAYK